MNLVADSGALYALYDKRDAHHLGAVRVLSAIRGSIIIPTVILSEVDYLFTKNLGVDAELTFIDDIQNGVFVLEQFTQQDLIRVRELVSAYRHLDLGIADAAVIATAERLKIRQIFTLDEKDFRAVKAAHGQLTLLPADL